MELTIALAISILGAVLSVSTFVIGRRDKAVKDTKVESASQALLNYRLDELAKKVDQILVKLDRYDKEIDEKIDLAIERHEQLYHKKGE